MKCPPLATPLLWSNPRGKLCVCVLCVCQLLSHIWLSATSWTGAPLGSHVHGILQARILEWVAISFSRGSSQPKDWPHVSCLAGRFFTIWATREAWCYGRDCFQARKFFNISYMRRSKLPPWPFMVHQPLCVVPWVRTHVMTVGSHFGLILWIEYMSSVSYNTLLWGVWGCVRLLFQFT